MESTLQRSAHERNLTIARIHQAQHTLRHYGPEWKHEIDELCIRIIAHVDAKWAKLLAELEKHHADQQRST